MQLSSHYYERPDKTGQFRTNPHLSADTDRTDTDTHLEGVSGCPVSGLQGENISASAHLDPLISHRRDQGRIRQARWRKRHPEICHERSRVYAADHPEQIRWTKSLWYLRNKDALKARRLGVTCQNSASDDIAKWINAARR
jgi:hypothetical protein